MKLKLCNYKKENKKEKIRIKVIDIHQISLQHHLNRKHLIVIVENF